MKPLVFYHSLYEEYAALPHLKGVDIILKVPDLGRKLKLAGFEKESDECFNVMLDMMRKYAAEGNAHAVVLIENLVYAAFVKTTESEDHYLKCFNLWSQMLQKIGRTHRRAQKKPRDPRKICFVLQAAVLLGHTEVMFTVIDAWRAMGLEAELYVAAVGAADPRFQAHLESRNITFLQTSLDKGQEIPLGNAVLAMRDQLEKIGIGTVVWASAPTLASYALTMKLAPRQVLWSVKFHPVFLADVDNHLCGGHECEVTRDYHGHDWTVSPFPLTLQTKKNSPEAVRQIRAAFPADAIVLGALGREEKINSPPFLMAVCGILARNPHAHFLWTGRSQPEEVQTAFKRFGVEDRCHFIGWVDTNLYGEAIDIFLETFPFGCGITGFQAMSQGTPLLSMQDMDTLYGYQLYGAVKQQFHGQPVPKSHFESLDILTAADQAHYMELAQKLIDDRAYRKEIGAREKAYFQREQDAVPRYAKRLWTNMTDLPA